MDVMSQFHRLHISSEISKYFTGIVKSSSTIVLGFLVLEPLYNWKGVEQD